MANLTPELALQRVPGIQAQIDSSNNVLVRWYGTTYHLGPHGLAMLDAFYQPVSVAEALKKLSTTITGRQDWTALTTTIVQLHEAGILQDENQRNQGPRAEQSGYGALDIHDRMLNDRVRTSGFLRGINEVVRPDDIVLDLGTGTGILAIAAARARAKHVYAIEASGIRQFSKAIFKDNGVADRVTLLQGWSTRLSLPERADVLISEMIGNEPLQENVLEVTIDARKRLLKPDARLIPSKIRVFGLPVSIPRAELMKHVPTVETVQNWRSWYGIDLGQLAEIRQSMFPAFYIEPQKASHWEVLSEPVLLAEVNLKEVEQLLINNSVTVTANTSGQLDGLLVYFELDLGPSTSLATHPAHADEDNHWTSPIWALVEPLRLQSGDQFEVTYQYRATEVLSRVTVARV